MRCIHSIVQYQKLKLDQISSSSLENISKLLYSELNFETFFSKISNL